MIQAKCIQKFRNKQGQIYGYRLQDINGNIQDVKPDNLKQAIRNNQINIVNLNLTSDNRLMDTPIKNKSTGVIFFDLGISNDIGVIDTYMFKNLDNDKVIEVPIKKVKAFLNQAKGQLRCRELTCTDAIKRNSTVLSLKAVDNFGNKAKLSTDSSELQGYYNMERLGLIKLVNFSIICLKPPTMFSKVGSYVCQVYPNSGVKIQDQGWDNTGRNWEDPL